MRKRDSRHLNSIRRVSVDEAVRAMQNEKICSALRVDGRLTSLVIRSELGVLTINSQSLSCTASPSEYASRRDTVRIAEGTRGRGWEWASSKNFGWKYGQATTDSEERWSSVLHPTHLGHVLQNICWWLFKRGCMAGFLHFLPRPVFEPQGLSPSELGSSLGFKKRRGRIVSWYGERFVA